MTGGDYKFQSPIGLGKIQFTNPAAEAEAQMGFFSVRSPIASRTGGLGERSFGAGYFKAEGRGMSPFFGSPSSKVESLVKGGDWMFEKYQPLEFERGGVSGFTPAEKFVLEPLLRNTPEWNMMRDVRSMQESLRNAEAGSFVTQKTPYSYRPTAINQEAWNAFLDVIQQPQYRENVVIGGSTVAETFVRSGKFRPSSPAMLMLSELHQEARAVPG